MTQTEQNNPFEVKELFALKYYHATLDKEEFESVKSLIDFNANLVDSLDQGNWQQRCNTSFPSFLSHQDFKNECGNTIIDTQSFSEIILKHFIEYFKSIWSVAPNRVSLQLESAWLNSYDVGHSQEPHNHSTQDVNFSGCIYLNYNKDKDSKFYFIDADPSNYSHGYNSFLFANTIYPEINEGDLILFPSCTQHAVEVQKNPTNRTTLSFNVSIK